MKYFLLGAFSSAFFLFGMALLYGYAGSVGLAGIADAARRSAQHDDALLFVGLRCSRSACCSRSARCRSTPGPRTSTRARRPR